MEHNKFYNILLKKGRKLHKKYVYKYIGKGKNKIKIYTYKHKFEHYLECRPNKDGYYTCDECKQILEAAIQLENEKKFRNTTLLLSHRSYKTYSFLPETYHQKYHNRMIVTTVYLFIDCHGQIDNENFQ